MSELEVEKNYCTCFINHLENARMGWSDDHLWSSEYRKEIQQNYEIRILEVNKIGNLMK